ncbi:MAG: alkaline phosphatase family protein [Thermodesulfobacteriota bacterium]|jgi:predicted AlkP superfamily phosphohydrolase/phosphomutase|nr:MAG: alkaline phosphatase family protein [Thermodesulfobacteriota bacterium]
MKNKVVIIGIDGMDSLLVEKFMEEMPNFRKIRSQSPAFRFQSIFPPDSTPAWASIYTGLNPARHGIINFINPADKSGKVLRKEVSDGDFRGRTFWDIAAKAGKKSCIVLPFNIFPGWPVNGSMVCRINTVASKNHPLSAFPDFLTRKYKTSAIDLNMLQEYFSLKDFPRLAKMCRNRTIAEGELAYRMLREEEWDLFFVYFSALDGIQHFFWNYYDETHPNYPGAGNPYEDVIREFYTLIDKVVGDLVLVLDDVCVIIVSDHGHGIRPTNLLNINEVLRQSGYLYPSAGKTGKKINPLYHTKFLKKAMMSYVNRFGVGNIGLKLSQKFPIWKKVLASPLSIDWGKTKAYVTDLSAVKSYSYGGIRINRETVDEKEIPSLIDEIIKSLTEVRGPHTSQNVMKRIMRREELYQGEYINRYPEIIVELDEKYGLGWEIQGALFEYGVAFSLQPGSHKKDSPVLYVLNKDADYSKDITLMDIAPSVFRCLGLAPDILFDGTSFL